MNNDIEKYLTDEVDFIAGRHRKQLSYTILQYVRNILW